jgi:hypothetical protein
VSEWVSGCVRDEDIEILGDENVTVVTGLPSKANQRPL